MEFCKRKERASEWFGSLPSSWSVIPLKYMFSIKKSIAGETGHTVLSVTQKGIKPKKMNEKGQFALDYSKYQLVNSGDFIMNHMDLLTGWVDISQYDGVTSPDYRVFSNTDPERFSSEYYNYIFQLCYINRIFYGMGQGVAGFGRWRLPSDMFLKFPLPVPDIDEQRAISSYLDEQCTLIDNAIVEAKASIDEYKTWRLSVISEAVTKGVDTNVTMKDSGIEWIGMIPTTSNIIRLRYLVNGYKAGPFGSSLITDKLLNEGTILVYTPEHIANQSVENEKNLYLPDDRMEEMAQFIVQEGDIIFPIVGSLGRAMLIKQGMPTGIINQRLAKLRIDEKVLDVDYFMWVFARGAFLAPYIDINCRGSFIVNLTKSIVYDMPLVVPNSIETQRRIAAYLTETCGVIDELITEKQELIAGLEAYKRSLIFEVVTGKRKVVQ